MRLIRDERAYRRVLGNFLGFRSSADVFISRFSHLWRCDGAPLACNADVTPAFGAKPGFYGLMDSINSLCEEYSSSLPNGCGYRVSEEQFRKEVESLMGKGSHPSKDRNGRPGGVAATD
jgi:hypothetical protein